MHRPYLSFRGKILAGLALIAACTAPLPAAAALDLSRTLVVAGEGTSVINPLLNEHDELPTLIFSGLLKYDAKGQPVPDLCREYSYDADTLTYTFYLREDVTWHDGAPFAAEDVVYTYEEMCFDEAVLSPVKSDYQDIKDISAPDAYTVKISLAQPDAAMPGCFTLGILPAHLLKGQDLNTAAFNQAPVGTGRYQFVSWDRAGGRIELARNDKYYGKVPAIEHLLYCTTADEGVKSMMLLTGEADLAWLNANFAKQFRGKAGFAGIDFVTADFRALSLDFNTPFWQRNADSIAVLNLAIDKEALVKSVLAGHGEPAFSPIQRHPLGGNRKADLYPYDLTRFETEMARLGWEKGADGIYARHGERFAFTIQVREYELERVDLANITARMLRQAGVEMRVVPVPRFDFAAGYNGYLSGFAAQFDPDQLYSLLVSGQSNNNMSYHNEKVDELLTKARRAADPEERRALYQAFEVEFAEHPALVPLVYLDGNYVSIAGLKGLNTARVLGHHASGVFWNIEDWTLTK